MKINLKELLEILIDKKSDQSIFDKYIGKWVIVRSRNEGVNFGQVENLNENGVILKRSRRLWSHKPKDENQKWYEGVANSGLASTSELSAALEEDRAIIEDYSIIVCTPEAIESIQNF